MTSGVLVSFMIRKHTSEKHQTIIKVAAAGLDHSYNTFQQTEKQATLMLDNTTGHVEPRLSTSMKQYLWDLVQYCKEDI